MINELKRCHRVRRFKITRKFFINMKQTFLSILLMLLPMLASADAVEIDGIWYNLITKIKEAEVTRNPNGYSENVEIPPSVMR